MAKYISVSQAANRLKVSTETIYNYCKNGVLGGQYIKTGKKGTWKIELESLELLEANSSFKSTLQLKNTTQYNLFLDSF
ncbi:helix-turn-helix domain-containing protein [Fusobacterium necrophorum]|uniref:helix-turn-helix domain-containing protein n=1 Tax=Fusobacterium necrophorum TaxID=859 RepID=UPI00254A0526|nr:helix-turn-helix domain-containing protein [Fusobacterium necrophorum]MDK4471138.1 helix-turn-helix domain-containing protein [Fusobacterium necrophorum]MDK4473095.1 helix-turn-helix domain-containing protein [Fusobacterium necrophorum]MDK4479001.1 helix-turn-helix domain-containing protein [Fusobacterium necrophorum]MDK4519016.1 helix-turn-helix domain-containing protein [Fusobacterium necrophorum]